MDLRDAINELKRIELQAIGSQCVDAVADETLAVAKEFSSGNPVTGNLSYADLRAADYPYAKRHPKTLGDFVNKHRGVFWDAWQRSGDRVLNDSEVADFIKHGTKNMHARDIDELVEAEAEIRGQKLAEAIVRRALP